MRDDGLPTMQYKPLCNTPNWSPPKGILIWKETKPTKECSVMATLSQSDSMKNEEEIIEEIYGYVKYLEGSYEEDNAEVVCRQYKRLIPYK